MLKFNEPVYDVVRFGNDVIVTSDCPCDFGGYTWGDDDYCTGGTGEGGDVECIVTDAQGNC